MAKKTQTELLQEISDHLLPISNLAKYQISQINAQLKAAEDKQKQTKNKQDGKQ